MASNDQVILKRILQQNKARTAPDLSDSDFFELFVAEQVLKSFDLSNDELESGITGGGNDGGIDAIYTFVNGQLLFEDSDLSGYKKGIVIDLFIIQAKKSDGFEGSALDKLYATSNDILDLSKSTSSLKKAYDDKLLRSTVCFRMAQENLASKFPGLRISYVYASLGDTERIHPNVSRKVDNLRSVVATHFSNAEFKFSFLGAQELLELTRKVPSNAIRVNLLDHIAVKDAYLCLINLNDYYQFIIDDDNSLRKNIFDANVRDYQGKVEVNQGIKNTLLGSTPEDFWWLNNGITIIASNASIASKIITIEDPQIVNGLQTSTEIYEYFKMSPKTSETRAVLVRIIVTNEAASQDRIIRATNSQTAISLASLKATDKVQRDIEDFFRTNNLYYDRRKNFYKNQGYKRDKIVSIPYLAQAIMAIVLRKPDEARARPSSILKRDHDYKQIFNASYRMELYLKCALIMKITDNYIKNNLITSPAEEKNNLKFYFGMYIVLSKTGKVDYKVEDIVQLDLDKLDNDFLEACWERVTFVFRQYQENHPNLNPDTIGKSKDFVEAVLKHFTQSRQEIRS